MTKNTTNTETVGLLGFGTIGAQIAEVLIAAGHAVTVLEIDDRKVLDSLADTARDRIRVTTDVADLESVDLVIEAIDESKDAKVALLSEVAGVVRQRVPLLSVTSALSITELAAELPEPSRVAGLHFFYPATTTRTVEIVAGLRTDPELVERLTAFVDGLEGKEPLVVKDRPGFLVGSMLMPYLNDVIAEFDDELASAEDLDIALKLGLGYKIGPLELLDQIGLDSHLDSTAAVFAATGDSRFAPPPLLRRMVSAGQLGVKSGSGFRINTTATEQEH